jgi:flagellum-specific ATP synthase
MSSVFSHLSQVIGNTPFSAFNGEVAGVHGMTLQVAGLQRLLAVGARCQTQTVMGDEILCEAVGFKDGNSVVMAYGSTEGIAVGSAVNFIPDAGLLRPSLSWKGRVVNALAKPIDGLGPLLEGDSPYRIRSTPPNGYARRRVGEKLSTGVRALDVFVPVCRGQRLGIFAGSGVGKSSLLSMLARGSDADINVVALVGERGREVQEFIQEDLGAEGLAKSIIIVSTSDEPPLMRRQAAWTAMAVAEFFRDQGLQVLFMMDSVTRFAMAQREVGLSAGEPPTSKGYPPTVFAELPRLLERAGPGMAEQGDITGIFTVLVDGDDHNEPISDAVRGILDGHIVLDRKIAERGRYPAVNILRSVSRTLPGCHNEEEYAIYKFGRMLASAYEDMAELIRIGAYKRGTNPRVDAAMMVNDSIEGFLSQRKGENTPPAEAFETLAEALIPARDAIYGQG